MTPVNVYGRVFSISYDNRIMSSIPNIVTKLSSNKFNSGALEVKLCARDSDVNIA
jgi:hypothetical protein